jgi:chemotaxis protein MotB
MAEARPIVVKRIKKVVGGHHGGAWKIAYADFVTAMMAFFLLMWLLGSTTKGDLQGIASYFATPLRVAMEGGSGSGDSSSIIKGGGKDLTRQEGQVQNASAKLRKKTFDLKGAEASLRQQEKLRLETLKAQIQAAIDANPMLKQFKKQLLLDITTEGLRIQIVDEQNRPMFATASADLEPYTKDILRAIGQMLNTVPNRISLTGHTDAAPYANGGTAYSNWELSCDRANASRRELVAGGMNEDKVLRVVGMASSIPLDKENPMAPINRRISIIVLNKKTEDDIIRDGATVNTVTGKDLSPGTLAPVPAVAPSTHVNGKITH